MAFHARPRRPGSGPASEAALRAQAEARVPGRNSDLKRPVRIVVTQPGDLGGEGTNGGGGMGGWGGNGRMGGDGSLDRVFVCWSFHSGCWCVCVLRLVVKPSFFVSHCLVLRFLLHDV